MALRKRTNSYWKKRSEQRLSRSERLAKPYIAQLRRMYSKSRIETVKSLQKIYATYYKDDKGFDKQALRSIVPTGEIRQFLDEMKRLGLKTDLPANYDARVTRLRFLNAQMEAEAQKAALGEQNIDEEALRNIYTDSYYRAGFDVARGIGSTPSTFSTLDTPTIDKVMNARFEGRNFSSRIWRNSDILAKSLKEELAVAIANGQSVYKTASQFRHRFDVQQSYAERLIRTETNHFHNEAELDAYKSMGFEYYQFLATLDNRTSEICQEMDGKKFKVVDGMPGENVPPLHPNCRSTIVPYFKGYEPETRLYRDPETGRNGFIGGDVTYKDWKNSYTVKKSKSELDSVHGKKAFSVDNHKQIVDKYKKKQKEIYDSLEEHEKAFYDAFRENIGKIELIPKDTPAYGELAKPTNDFIWNRMEWELKATFGLKYKTTASHIRDAAKQGKKNFILDIHSKSSQTKAVSKFLSQIKKYNLRNPQNQIDNLFALTSDGLIELIKKKKK